MHPAVSGVPGDGGFEVAVAELRERHTLGGVGLAEIVAERPELFGVALGKGGQSAAWADGAELAVVSDDNQLCSGSFDSREEPGEVDI